LRAIILAGGYARRMWPLTRDVPKPLLPVSGRPAVDIILDRVREVNVTEVVISTNLKFTAQFKTWLDQTRQSNVKIVSEQSVSEEGKLGAIYALSKLTEVVEPDDYLVLAGDNLFTASLTGMVAFYKELAKPVVAVYEAQSIEQVRAGSAIILDKDMRIISFEEKPKHPRTNMIGACMYVFPYATLQKTREYIAQGGKKDEPGNFVAWLCANETVYGYRLGGLLWDIGTTEEYERTKQEFARKTTLWTSSKRPLTS
jgi:glucose-1-phosphate thymidylyltransferase